MYKFYSKSKAGIPMRANRHRSRSYIKEAYLTMLCLMFTLSLLAQSITLKETNAPLKKVFLNISRQSGLEFLASNSVLEVSKPVSIDVADQPLASVLEMIFSKQNLNFEIKDKVVIVTKKSPTTKVPKDPRKVDTTAVIDGIVKDSTNLGLPGATIKVKGSSITTIADKNGNFTIAAKTGQVLEVSFIGYYTKTVVVGPNETTLLIFLQQSPSKLNEIQIIGYGATTKKLNTGSQSSISSKDIADQPVTNALSALSGRMPGVFVQTTNGLPGGNVNIQIRGKGSIQAGTDPLYIIDDVPFPSAVVPSTNIIIGSSITGAISPMNSINPSDIENITVLKDADATAIYGSRGSNGVVLITTKKGRAGVTKTDFNFSQAVTRITNKPNLLDNRQYLDLRREAFKNDGVAPTIANAPDLLLWDTTQTTDWSKYFFGGTGRTTDLQGSISGGNNATSFNLGGNFRRETTVLPGDNLYQRVGLHLTLQHRPENSRFSLLFSGSYVADHNRATNIVGSVASALILPPNYPLYDATGNYNWNMSSPLAALEGVSKIKTDNLITNLTLNYRLTSDLDVKISGGFNKVRIDQTSIFPTLALFPGSINYTNFGSNGVQSTIIEPQLNYRKIFQNSSLNILIGGTYQNRTAPTQTIQASNFTTRSLMENIGSAATIQTSNSFGEYKYVSLFGRVTYNIGDTYIFNATVRRDGSSRFGPDDRFGTFGSVGAAWLFSNYSWIRDNLSFISYGKLRGSYGITGNDQIPDYQFLSTYGSSTTYNYQNFAALVPNRIANDNFHWETTKKLDLALELGFLKDRLLLTLEHYQSRSDDQLVAYAIPYITGFNTYQANLPATVENRGWEISLNTQQINSNGFKWNSNFNLTIPRNQLKSFENFASSSYAQTLQVGYDITRITGYRMIGVDKTTGKASYAGQDGTASATPYLYHTLGKQTPDLFGGLGNSLSYKSWQLDVFMQFAKQAAKGGLFTGPGLKFNNYSLILDRWTQPGDETNIPKATTVNDPYFSSSNVNFFDASYIRLKNVSLSYSFPANWLTRSGMKQVRLYAQAQNLVTWWHQKSAFLDPESGPLVSTSKNVPPMRTIAIGVQTSF